MLADLRLLSTHFLHQLLRRWGLGMSMACHRKVGLRRLYDSGTYASAKHGDSDWTATSFGTTGTDWSVLEARFLPG